MTPEIIIVSDLSFKSKWLGKENKIRNVYNVRNFLNEPHQKEIFKLQNKCIIFFSLSKVTLDFYRLDIKNFILKNNEHHEIRINFYYKDCILDAASKYIQELSLFMSNIKINSVDKETNYLYSFVIDLIVKIMNKISKIFAKCSTISNKIKMIAEKLNDCNGKREFLLLVQ